jgi:hypothetical protein
MNRHTQHHRAQRHIAAWIRCLSSDEYQIAFGYTDTGPTLDLYRTGIPSPIRRWLLQPTGGRR